jgi:hypothetical protein
MRAFLQRACRDAFVMKTEVDLCSSRRADATRLFAARVRERPERDAHAG